jgi:4-hydroxybenzoate polyprenyltransferase
MSSVKNYLSLIKFSHTIFAMPFAIIGFFLALGANNYLYESNSLKFIFIRGLSPIGGALITLCFIVLCMVFARSAAMAFNRWLDAKYDAANPRTVAREIPAGIIKATNALIFVIINSLLFVITTFFINKLCFYLSPIALFVILFYSYTKRFTALCHLVLGVGLGLAPIGAYLAVTGSFSLLPLLFSFSVLFWVSGFDIIYALQDEAFDKQQQLHSIPTALGKVNALHFSRLLHLLSAGCILYAGWYGSFGIFYWCGAAVFVGLLLYQQSIVKANDLSRVNMAFFTANGIASIVFASFVITDVLLNNSTTLKLWLK